MLLYVFGQAELAPRQPGLGAGAAVQREHATRAGANLDPAGQISVGPVAGAGGAHQVDDVAVERLADMHGAHLGAGGEDVLGGCGST